MGCRVGLEKVGATIFDSDGPRFGADLKNFRQAQQARGCATQRGSSNEAPCETCGYHMVFV